MDGQSGDDLLIQIQQPTTSSLNQSGSNDFVKKLFQMLQDDSYKEVVKWTSGGDLFVVINTNEFTKEILPRHFKHSNFASFVRQLNKYDFHKVKIPNEEKQSYQYGGDAWEFKHPDFRINDRDALENIKRKGPTTKKIGSTISNGMTDQISEEIALMKQDFKSLASENKNLRQDISVLQTKYKAVVENIVTLKQLDERYYRSMGILVNTLIQAGIKLPPLDIPNPSLASLQLPSNANPGSIGTQNLSQQSLGSAHRFEAPFNPMLSQSRTQNQASQAAVDQLGHPSAVHIRSNSNFMDSNDIDTSSQITNLAPPSVKLEEQTLQQQRPSMMPTNAAPGVTPPQIPEVSTTNLPNPKYHVLLVEDDNVCIQLCRKFLVKYGCQVTVATDGLNAILTVENSQYDLVLMDIVMPNLDGATATSIIRSFDQKTPIIAMTGNVEEHDLVTYLNTGMSDILAKPFTKDDLYSMLQKHLLLTDPGSGNTATAGTAVGLPTQSPAVPPDDRNLSSGVVSSASDNVLMDVMGSQHIKKQRLQ